MPDYAGIYLERDAAYVSIVDTGEFDGDIDKFAIDKAERILIFKESFDGDKVQNEILYFVEIILRNTSDLRSIGICCFGPFKSLSLSERRKYLGFKRNLYGVTEDTGSDKVRSFDFFNVIRAALTKLGNTKHISIGVHTDAMAGAIAEAHIRQMEDNEILFFVFLTSGIGGAYSFGRKPMDAATHSEVGNIQVRPHPKDDATFFRNPDFPDRKIESLQRQSPGSGDHFYGDVGSIAHIENIEKRRNKLRPDRSINDFMFGDFRKMLTYYFAQICLNVISTLPPKKIVVGGEITGSKPFVKELNGAFTRIQKARPGMAFPRNRRKYIEPASRVGCTLVLDGQPYKGDVEAQYIGPSLLGAYAVQWDDYERKAQI